MAWTLGRVLGATERSLSSIWERWYPSTGYDAVPAHEGLQCGTKHRGGSLNVTKDPDVCWVYDTTMTAKPGLLKNLDNWVKQS